MKREMQVGRILNKGSYGIVYEGTLSDTKEDIVVKRNTKCGSTDFMCAIRELDILSTLGSHTRLANLRLVVEGSLVTYGVKPIRGDEMEDDVHFVFDRYRGDLLQEGKDSLSADKIRIIARDILLALEYIHSRDVMHRDIKPANILWDSSDGHARLCDFGLSMIVSDNFEKDSGLFTIWFKPPEVLLRREDYVLNADIWSLGVVIFGLLDGEELCNGCNGEVDVLIRLFDTFPSDVKKMESLMPNDLLDYLFRFRPKTESSHANRKKRLNYLFRHNKLLKGCSYRDDLIDLLAHMLEPDPAIRVSATEALKHKVFDMDREVIESVKAEVPDKLPLDIPYDINNDSDRLRVAKIIMDIDADVEETTTRALFHAMEIFDRTRLLMEKGYDVTLFGYACSYISMKYFCPFSYESGYECIFFRDKDYGEEYIRKTIAKLGEIECDILDFMRGIYMHTPLEYCKNEKDRDALLAYYCTKVEGDGLFPEEIYKMFLVAKEKILKERGERAVGEGMVEIPQID